MTYDKGGEVFDPVTVADRAAEKAMRAVLERERPDDAILGEEFGETEGSSGLTWVLDPIDGTRGYISGTPTWGVLISVADKTGPLFGLIDQPYIGERFAGGFGVAEVHGPLGHSVLTCRKDRNLYEATVLTTFPEVGTAAEGAAAGQVDFGIEAGLTPYDIHAPIAVVMAAGGVVTDWTGGPAHAGGRAIAAATPALHAEALAILQKTLHA